nr:unnamed protein product [Naegleria fowleri]
MPHALYSDDDDDDDQALREFLHNKYSNITVSNNTSSTRNLLAHFNPQQQQQQLQSTTLSNPFSKPSQPSIIHNAHSSLSSEKTRENDEDTLAYQKFLSEKGRDLATRASLNTTSSRNILAGVDVSFLSKSSREGGGESTATKEVNHQYLSSSSTHANGSLLGLAQPKLQRENSSMIHARPMLRRENSVMISAASKNTTGVPTQSSSSEDKTSSSDGGSLLRANSSMGLARKPGVLRRENSSIHALKALDSSMNEGSEQQQQQMVKLSNSGTRKGALHRENSIVGKTADKTNLLKSSHLNQSMPVISQVSPARRSISKRLLTNYSQNALHDDTTSVVTTETDKVSLNEMETEVKITHNSELAKVNCLVSQYLACGFPVMVFDKNGTVEYLNKEAEKTFGVYSFSALGEGLHEFFLHNSVSEIHQAIHEFFNSNEEAASSNTQHGDCPISTSDLNYYNNLPQEKQLERKNTLMKTRTLRGKSSLRNKFFILTTRIIPVVKCEEIHFAAYMQKHPIFVKDSKAHMISRCAQAIIDIMIIPIISITDHGIIQTFNSAACSTFGYKSYQVLGRNIKMLCNAKDRAKHDTYLEKYRHTREKRVLDRVTRVKGQTKTGKVIPLEIRVSEVLEPHGKSSFVAYLRDYRTLATAEESSVRIAAKIYPKSIAERLELEERVVDTIPKCSIMYCELLGISDFVKARSSRTVVRSLNDIFSKFEQISSKLGIEQMKVVGDGYMLASGIDKSEPGHSEKLIKAAIEMIRFVRLYASQLNDEHQKDDHDFEIEEIALKVGIHSSSDIVAATIGKQKPTFDLFGKGVEISKILAATGKPNQCHMSNDCYKEVTSEKLLRGFVEHFREAEQVYLENRSCLYSMPQSTWTTQL